MSLCGYEIRVVHAKVGRWGWWRDTERGGAGRAWAFGTLGVKARARRQIRRARRRQDRLGRVVSSVSR